MALGLISAESFWAWPISSMKASTAAPEEIRRAESDYLLFLRCKLRDKIAAQMSFVREWGGQFSLPTPKPKILGL